MAVTKEWRDLWSYKIEYLLAACALVFSTTNLLNLPYYIAHNGGFAFVIAYGVCLLVFCLPVLIMELAVGQLTGRAPVQALYNICPLFKGVGVAQVLYSFAVMSYMAVKIGYLLWFMFYLVASFEQPETPWLSCSQPWTGTADCTTVNWTMSNRGGVGGEANDGLLPNAVVQPASPIVRFLDHIRNPSQSIEIVGEIQWRAIASTGTVWVVLLFIVFAGVRWLGKVLYLTFLIPLGLMLALIARGLTLPGWPPLLDGMFRTDLMLLKDVQIWKAALGQSIYAFGIGTGTFITLGSYNSRRNNLVCDAVFVLFFHVATVVGQLTVAVGFMGNAAYQIAYQNDEAIILAFGESQFFNYLGAMSHVPQTKLWSAVLVIFVIFLLLNIMIVLTLMMLAAAEDAFGQKASGCCARTLLTAVICALGCALSLIHTTQAGKYTQLLMNDYLDYITLWIIIAFELLAVAWFYGSHRLGKDIHTMVSNCCCWIIGHTFMYLLYLLPAASLFVLVMKLWRHSYPSASGMGLETDWHGIATWQWSEYVGWTIAVVPLLPIPLYMIYSIISNCCCSNAVHVTKCQRLRDSVTSPLRYELLDGDFCDVDTIELDRGAPKRAYQPTAAPPPGYAPLPQHLLTNSGSRHAPLAQPELFDGGYAERVVTVSNIYR